ncbi:unnamed protein product [Danaus chrysippus]|uniref:(African queen) hypothetical protein n=1 Tax=Danaus chrysippus TaxID=151541 RepID=A0A8J2W0G2_9NEOP|nr:unnamed protein product [Danaus chrysippus]
MSRGRQRAPAEGGRAPSPRLLAIGYGAGGCAANRACSARGPDSFQPRRGAYPAGAFNEGGGTRAPRAAMIRHTHLATRARPAPARAACEPSINSLHIFIRVDYQLLFGGCSATDR